MNPSLEKNKWIAIQTYYSPIYYSKELETITLPKLLTHEKT